MTRHSSKKRRRSNKHQATDSPVRKRSRKSDGRSRRRRSKVEGDRRSLKEETFQISQKGVRKKRPVFIQNLFNLIFYLLTIAVLAGAVLFSLSKDSDKSFFGYRFYTVLTNSMMPIDSTTQKGGFAAGDIIIVQLLNPKELKVGDIITYRLMTADPQSKTVLTHRIIEELGEQEGEDGLFFKTQGDANSGADRPINQDQIIGKKVLVIPKVGVIMSFLRENFLVSLGTLIAIFALIISLRYYFSFSPSKDPLSL